MSIFIVLIIKYGLLIKVKSIAIRIFNLLKDVFVFLFGLCTPYLTERNDKNIKKNKEKYKEKKEEEKERQK